LLHLHTACAFSTAVGGHVAIAIAVAVAIAVFAAVVMLGRAWEIVLAVLAWGEGSERMEVPGIGISK